MRAITAGWVAEATGGKCEADPGITITSVVRDSREAGPGALYVALAGDRADGHDFVDDAFKAGAVLALVSKPVDGPCVRVSDSTEALGLLARAYLRLLKGSGGPTVIGITGSVGKTTTKDLLAKILPRVVVPVASYNNEIGLPLTVLEADDSTDSLVLEMGANGAHHIERLCQIAPPDVAVVLAVGSAHIGMYASIDEVAETKAEIIRDRAEGAAVLLNADDARVMAMANLADRVVTFGIESGDIRAEDITMEEGRPRFLLTKEGESARVALRLVGRHNITNALAAATVGFARGMDIDEVAGQLGEADAVSPHRMALTDRPDGVTVLDDSYNASPESMEAALEALGQMAEGRRAIAVVGEMLELGAESRNAHEEVGRLAGSLRLDGLVVVGEGARPAYDVAVRERMVAHVDYVDTVDDAAVLLEGKLAPGDMLLLKASHDSGLWELADRLTRVVQ